jgi:hypothetical protein
MYIHLERDNLPNPYAHKVSDYLGMFGDTTWDKDIRRHQKVQERYISLAGLGAGDHLAI